MHCCQLICPWIFLLMIVTSSAVPEAPDTEFSLHEHNDTHILVHTKSEALGHHSDIFVPNDAAQYLPLSVQPKTELHTSTDGQGDAAAAGDIGKDTVTSPRSAGNAEALSSTAAESGASTASEDGASTASEDGASTASEDGASSASHGMTEDVPSSSGGDGDALPSVETDSAELGGPGSVKSLDSPARSTLALSEVESKTSASGLKLGSLSVPEEVQPTESSVGGIQTETSERLVSNQPAASEETHISSELDSSVGSLSSAETGDSSAGSMVSSSASASATYASEATLASTEGSAYGGVPSAKSSPSGTSPPISDKVESSEPDLPSVTSLPVSDKVESSEPDIPSVTSLPVSDKVESSEPDIPSVTSTPVSDKVESSESDLSNAQSGDIAGRADGSEELGVVSDVKEVKDKEVKAAQIDAGEQAKDEETPEDQSNENEQSNEVKNSADNRSNKQKKDTERPGITNSDEQTENDNTLNDQSLEFRSAEHTKEEDTDNRQQASNKPHVAASAAASVHDDDANNHNNDVDDDDDNNNSDDEEEDASSSEEDDGTNTSSPTWRPPRVVNGTVREAAGGTMSEADRIRQRNVTTFALVMCGTVGATFVVLVGVWINRMRHRERLRALEDHDDEEFTVFSASDARYISSTSGGGYEPLR